MFNTSLASQVDSDLQLSETEEPFNESFPRFLLIGLGPFAKHNYFNLFKRHKVYPEFIVDLDCMKIQTEEFLRSKNLQIPSIYFPESQRNTEKLSNEVKFSLLKQIKNHKITHAIICTEPKSHFAYLDFLIENNIHVLTEKPLTSTVGGSHSLSSAEKIENDFKYLIQKQRSCNKDLKIEVNCHRRYHPIYQYINNEIQKFTHEFDVPMTFCEIYHSDGMWNMPNEFLFRENHPYKYGYGKLLHSGYHFIDLLAVLLKNNYRYCNKFPSEAEIYAVPFSPSDFMNVFTNEHYKRFFKNNNNDEHFLKEKQNEYSHMGELDFFGILQFFKDNKRLTTCSINLLQTGFSRRAWDKLPEDTYKRNGRIRHERINLQFGHLLNIQVHSYLSTESFEKSDIYPFSVGGKKHFDIYIFRNSELIGGEPFKQISSDYFLRNSDQSFNEQSREKCFLSFLIEKKSLSGLNEHQLSIKLLSNSLKALSKKNSNDSTTIKFSITHSDFFSF